MRWNRRRALIGAAVLACVFAPLAYEVATSPRRWVAGEYSARSWDGAGTTTLRLSRDGSAAWENHPPGPTAPPGPLLGRWRVSGRVFVFETGATAAAPVDWWGAFLERFEAPMLYPERTRARVVEANDSGLVLDLGGVEWKLERVHRAAPAPTP